MVVNRRAEKVRDTYGLRIDGLQSVEKGLRPASRDTEKQVESHKGVLPSIDPNAIPEKDPPELKGDGSNLEE